MDHANEPEQEQCTFGTGDSAMNSDQVMAQTDGESQDGEKGHPSRPDSSKKRISMFASSLKNLVHRRSKSRNNEEDETKVDAAETKDELNKVENDTPGDGKRPLSKLLHNVSSFNKGRSSLSSTDIRDSRDHSEGGRTGFRIFKRSASKTDLFNSENLEGSKGGTLGRLFGRRSMSKTDLETEGGGPGMAKGSTLGRLFRRRSISKTEMVSDSNLSPDLKSASLGRRIGSSLMGAFGKKEMSTAREAP